MTSLAIPESVNQIGVSAFKGCTGLTSVSIPNSVVSIGQYAFHGCNGIKSVSIGNTVNYIGAYAFVGCGIKDLTCYAIEPPSCGTVTMDFDYRDYPPDFDIDNFTYSPFGCCLGSYGCDLYVPVGSVETYKSAEVWKDFEQIKPIEASGVKELPEDAEISVPITIEGNTVTVNAQAGTPVNIYSIDGMLRYQGYGSAEVDLPAGTYIICCGAETAYSGDIHPGIPVITTQFFKHGRTLCA